MPLGHTPPLSMLHQAAAPACSIVLLHGVGMSPMLFADVVDLLTPAGDRAVLAPARRGYRSGDVPVSSFDELMTDVAEMVAAVAPAVLVGVSGGATLALAAGAMAMPGVAAVVAHEPLVGPSAPALHDLVTTSARRLADSSGADTPLGTDHEAMAFVERLVGADVWARLPHEAHAFAAAHSAGIRCEVPFFVGHALDEIELRRTTVPITISTGALSDAPRRQAAEVLAGMGATSVTIAGAGHLVHCEQPGAFAALVVGVALLADAEHRSSGGRPTHSSTRSAGRRHAQEEGR